MPVTPGLSVVSPTDAALVERVLDGDVDAYGVLVARYRDRLGRYALHMLGDQAEAEDVVQETFVRSFRFLRQCAQPERFDAWLFRILANRCRTARAKWWRARRLFVPVEERHEAAAADHAVENAAWREEIQRALARLAPEQREAFLLKYVEDMSYEQMEVVTGAGVSALKMRVKRACDRLREQLEEVYHA